jgi:glycosyltransferase involved in cell wall biosynthesis
MTQGVSVVVANHDKSAYLRACLDSILGQTHRPLEVIVVDDASTDGSRDILQAITAERPNVEVALLDTNVGPAAARDHGISLARYERITTLDSDDFYATNDKIAREVRALSSVEDPDSVIAFSDIVLVDEQGRTLSEQATPHLTTPARLERWIATRMGPIPRDFLFTKAQYAAAGGYDPSVPLYEDWLLKMRLARANLWIHAGGAGVCYRQTSQGLSKAKRDEHEYWLKETFARAFSDHPLFDTYAKQLRRNRALSPLQRALFAEHSGRRVMEIVRARLRRLRRVGSRS